MTALPEAERIARLRLARTDRIGPVTFSQLLKRFGSAEQAIRALPDLAKRDGRSAYTVPPLSLIEDEIAAGDRIAARLIVLGDADYPTSLTTIDPPPAPVVDARRRQPSEPR